MSISYEPDQELHRVINKYSRHMIRIAFTYVKNIADAQDITQEVFLAYYMKKPKFVSEEHEKAWLIRVVINKSKNYVRARWFRERNPLPEDLSYLPKDEDMVLREVLSLDEKYRLPIHLHYYEGYSVQEIAKLLHTKPATIGTRLARGRQLLKKQLGGMDYEA